MPLYSLICNFYKLSDPEAGALIASLTSQAGCNFAGK